jgi:hypothetical protein
MTENLYYYSTFEASKFAGFVEWTLGFLQNLLG